MIDKANGLSGGRGVSHQVDAVLFMAKWENGTLKISWVFGLTFELWSRTAICNSWREGVRLA